MPNNGGLSGSGETGMTPSHFRGISGETVHFISDAAS
jgi:hypothetical protein